MSEFHRVIFRRAWFPGRLPTFLRNASVIFAKRVALPLLTSDDVMVVNSLVEQVVSSAPLTLDSQLPSTWIIFTDVTAKSTCQSGASWGVPVTPDHRVGRHFGSGLNRGPDFLHFQ